jgi:hypothetical protein
MMLGKVSIQSCHLRTQTLYRIGRAGQQFGMNAAAARIGSNANPAQRRILEARLCLVRTGVEPDRLCRPTCIERCKGLPRIWATGRRACRRCHCVCDPATAHAGSITHQCKFS